MVTAFEYVEDCNRKVLNYGWIEFPLAYTQVDDLMRVRLFKLNAPKYMLVLPQNFRLKNDLTTGCDLLCLRLLRRRPLWSPVS